MKPTHLPRHQSVRRRFMAVAVAALTATTAFASTGAAASAAAPRAQERALTFMTRNLYLGADLIPLTQATSQQEFLDAAQTVVAGMVATKPPLRMAEVAGEIAVTRPDIVGLQEASVWDLGSAVTGGAPIHWDYVALIQQALAKAGLPYDVAVSQDNFDSAAVLPASLQAALPVRFLDRDVLLVRRGAPVTVQATGAAHFAAQLPLTLLGQTIDFRRGYVWADVVSRGAHLRVVDAHTEAYYQPVAAAEATELLGVIDATRTAAVLVGDLNSDANVPEAAWTTLTQAGMRDAWSLTRPDQEGDTCCNAADLGNQDAAYDQRIDFVLVNKAVRPVLAFRVGVVPVVATAPYWPSDHAGVVATVKVPVGANGARS